MFYDQAAKSSQNVLWLKLNIVTRTKFGGNETNCYMRRKFTKALPDVSYNTS